MVIKAIPIFRVKWRPKNHTPWGSTNLYVLFKGVLTLATNKASMQFFLFDRPVLSDILICLWMWTSDRSKVVWQRLSDHGWHHPGSDGWYETHRTTGNGYVTGWWTWYLQNHVKCSERNFCEDGEQQLVIKDIVCQGDHYFKGTLRGTHCRCAQKVFFFFTILHKRFYAGHLFCCKRLFQFE